MRITVFSIFPEFFDCTAKMPILGRALDQGIWTFHAVDIRHYGIGKYKRVDDVTYGGGSGMILRPDVLSTCIDDHIGNKNQRILLTSPRGKLYNQQMAEQLSQSQQDLYIVCNRFEGVDQRIIQQYNMEEVSIGDYILMGGETAALAIIESIVRLLPGTFETDAGIKEDSFSESLQHMIEYDHYTQPAIWQQLSVPDVLKSGNHAKIAQWRHENAIHNTKKWLQQRKAATKPENSKHATK